MAKNMVLPDVGALGQERQVRAAPPVLRTDAGTAAPKAELSAAQDIERVAMEFNAAGERIQRREDAVARANTSTAYEEAMAAEARRMADEEDVSTPEAVTKYKEFQDNLTKKTMEGLNVSENGMAQITVDMAKIRSSWFDKFSVSNIAAGRKKVEDTLNGKVSVYSNRVTEDPGAVFDIVQEWDDDVEGFKGALNEDEHRDSKRLGRAVIIQSAATSMIDQGNLEGAEKLLKNLKSKGFDKDVSAKITLPLKTRISTRRRELSKLENAGNRWVQRFKQITGVDPNEEQRLIGALGSREPKTYAEDLKDLEKALGKDLTDEQTLRHLKLFAEEDDRFANNFPLLDIFARDTPDFANGRLGEEADRRYIGAATQYTQPRKDRDAVTGQPITIIPALPSYVTKAFESRGIELPRSTVAEEEPFSPPGAPEIPGQPGGGGAAVSPQAPQQSLFASSGLLTGPVSTTKKTLSEIPLVGRLVNAQKETSAQKFLGLMKRDLVTGLQNSPKFAEGERKQIESELEIDPRFWDDPVALRSRMIGIDQAIEVRLMNAFKQANDKTLPPERRKWARTIYMTLSNFRDQLGVPPQLSFDEVRQMRDDGRMKSGDVFIDPQGEIRTIR